MKPIHTQTYIFNIHDTQVSQTLHQIHHTACKQVSLWAITCIIAKLQRTEEKLITLFIEQMHRDTITFKLITLH